MSTYSGDEHLSHEQQYPELYEDDADPMDRPCDDCGAEPGEPCRVTCTWRTISEKQARCRSGASSALRRPSAPPTLRATEAAAAAFSGRRRLRDPR